MYTSSNGTPSTSQYMFGTGLASTSHASVIFWLINTVLVGRAHSDDINGTASNVVVVK